MKAVLYVDDNPNDVLLFQSACRLARVAFRLRTAAGGPEAIGYLGGDGALANRTEHPLPDFVLLDLKMPGKDGLRCCAGCGPIRPPARSRWRSIPHR